MEVVWTNTALETFLKVIDYLYDYWTFEKMNEFDIKVDKLIERVSIFDEICPESNLFGYRKCQIDQYNAMIYHIVNNKLLFVTFVDSRSNNIY